MLTPFDDYPVHQTALPVAHPATGDPNQYDRFFFNGYRDDLYFGVAMGLYPNRGVIDAAFSVVHDGVQRSVFASGRIPADRTQTRIGPLVIEILEPLGRTRVRCDAPDLGIDADVVFHPRTVAVEEPRQTIHDGSRLMMDVTRLTQWGAWDGSIRAGDGQIPIERSAVLGTKDRSWGIRPIGQPAPAAPSPRPQQIFFLWAPINFAERATHFLVFERDDGTRWVESAAVVPVLAGDGAPTWDPDGGGVEHLPGGDHAVRWEPGLRRAQGARIALHHPGRDAETIDLEPTITFRMRGIGYMHPEWAHGTWRGEAHVGAEEHPVEALDTLDPWNIHVQQVVRARSSTGEEGLGVLEQLVFGPHPSGFAGFLDGAGRG